MNGTPRDGFEGVRLRAAEHPADAAAAAAAGSRVVVRRLALLYAVAAAFVAVLALSLRGVSAAERDPEQPPALASIQVDPASAELIVGERTRFSATGVLDDGSRSEPDVQWSSGDERIVAVDAAGTATALAPGRATITASAAGVTGTAEVAVRAKQPPELASIQVDPESAELTVGERTQFRAAGVLADGSPTEPDVQWSSSDEQIVAVDASGVARALAPGRVTITAGAAGVTGTAEVTVRAELVAIQIAPDPVPYGDGGPVQLTVTGTASDGSKMDVTDTAQWSTSHDGLEVRQGGMLVRNDGRSGEVKASVEDLADTATVESIIVD